jgi:DNA-binding GntR family transcriptional regulator
MRRLSDVRSKRDLVIAEIRAAVLNGELAPGVRLVIDDLAEKLGVSTIPVREPLIGARVAEIEAESIVEVFTLLETMEVTSSRMACGRLQPEELTELETMVAAMDKLTSDAEAWSQQNRRFHEFICARAGTQLTASLIRKVLDHWDRLHRYFLKEVFADHLLVAQKQHWQILAAIRAGDPEEVEKLVRKHNQSALRAYQKYLRQPKIGRMVGNEPARLADGTRRKPF